MLHVMTTIDQKQTDAATDARTGSADTAGAAADWAPVVAAHPDMRFFAETGNLGSMLSGAFAD